MDNSRWVLIVALVGVIVIVGIFYFGDSRVDNNVESAIQKETVEIRDRSEDKDSIQGNTIFDRVLSLPESFPGLYLNISNWKIYRNENLNLEIKIPQSWPEPTVEVGPLDTSVGFSDGNKIQMELGGSIIITEKTSDYTLEDFRLKLKTEEELGFVKYGEEMTIDGRRALFGFFGEGSPGFFVALVHQNKLYIIRDGLLVPDILSTIKFLD